MKKFSFLLALLLVGCASKRYPDCPGDDFGFCAVPGHPGKVYCSVLVTGGGCCRCRDVTPRPQES